MSISAKYSSVIKNNSIVNLLEDSGYTKISKVVIEGPHPLQLIKTYNSRGRIVYVYFEAPVRDVSSYNTEQKFILKSGTKSTIPESFKNNMVQITREVTGVVIESSDSLVLLMENDTCTCRELVYLLKSKGKSDFTLSSVYPVIKYEHAIDKSEPLRNLLLDNVDLVTERIRDHLACQAIDEYNSQVDAICDLANKLNSLKPILSDAIMYNRETDNYLHKIITEYETLDTDNLDPKKSKGGECHLTSIYNRFYKQQQMSDIVSMIRGISGELATVRSAVDKVEEVTAKSKFIIDNAAQVVPIN